MTGAARTADLRTGRLGAWSLYAAVLAGAGLPIYIYAPAHYAAEFGVPLGTLGAALFGLRLLDVVQDPALGWVSERLGRGRRAAAAAGAALLAGAMAMLFAVPPPVAPLAWFALSLALLFSAFSFLTILFYAQGIAKAEGQAGGHVRLAAWRETGSLLGVCAAAAAPTLLAGVTERPFAAYAAGFAGAALLAAWAMDGEWRPRAGRAAPVPIGAILGDGPARRLLILAFVNAAPVAVSSTLFVFYVGGRLEAPGAAGPLLVLFFLAAALSAPLWGRAAERWGTRPALTAAMTLAVASFGWTATLGAGDVAAFAVICALSGASIGADLTLLPAAFARRMAAISPIGGQGFGLWATVSKATLAIAAAALLPILGAAGFVSGEPAPEAARRTLTILYAAVPCALKLMALAILARTPIPED